MKCFRMVCFYFYRELILIKGMGMEIKEKDMFLQGNEISAEFHYKGLMVAM